MHRSTGEPTNDMSKSNLQQQITVHALPSKVWRVLTGSHYVNQYLFKQNIQCDWMEGSAIFLMPEAGSPLSIGEVLESTPGISLKFRFREERTSYLIIVTYELIVAGDGIELKIKSEGFSATNQEFFIRLQQANLMLQKIKWLSEYS